MVPTRDRSIHIDSLIFDINTIRTRLYLDIFAALNSIPDNFGRKKEYSEIFNETLCNNILDSIYRKTNTIIYNLEIIKQLNLNNSLPEKLYFTTYNMLIQYLQDTISIIDSVNCDIDLLSNLNTKIRSRINHYNGIELEEFKRKINKWKLSIFKKSKINIQKFK